MSEDTNAADNHAQDHIKATELASVPAKFWPNYSYTSEQGAGASLSDNDLDNVNVGVQDTAKAEQAPVIATHTAEAVITAKKTQKQGQAQRVAYDAQAKRVSRRLLLAERAKLLTVSCPVTGVVSLLQIPAIHSHSLIWDSPLSDLANCRGLAQQGIEYLHRLDTQTLAGILIVLSDSYSLFKFQPYDSGVQKNAILRTAGKDYIIDAIIMIESLIHSHNASYLPKLSLIFDSNLEQFGLGVRMKAYLTILADAIAKPDKDVYDDNKAPKKIGRPVYIKDVEAKERKVSFLARQEIARAEKTFKDDKKAGKIAIAELVKANVISTKLKGLLLQLMTDEALLTVPGEMIGLICTKLKDFDQPQAAIIAEILRKDRGILMMDVSEVEEIVNTGEQDDPKPGQEAAIEDTEQEEVSEETSGEDEQSEVSASISPTAPEGLSNIEAILWRKKMVAHVVKNVVISNIPSVAIYKPGVDKINLGKDRK